MKSLALHLAVIALLFALQFVLPPYHHTNIARVMVLAVFAMGYNIAFGYTGLLSLGHALFFGAGLYAAGLMANGGWTGLATLPAGLLAGGLVALAVGMLALRTAGVSFMIVTLMFAQAGYLTILYFGPVTGGDEGFVLPAAARNLAGFDLATETPRYTLGLALFAVALLANLALVRSPLGRVMVAMRENEERSRMLGYNPFTVKLTALVISGLYAGVAGAGYALMFGYVGASFAAIQYSILPMLWVLLGGAGTVLGPFIGALLMFYLIDLSSSVTTAHQMVVGVALLALVLFAPKGLLGTLRERGLKWLP
ncbi:branched-chain amino acid ABC transporter permease [Fertoebacter nigrum]|uniref:Branched-chain amino acid ABC transporter permease n=1 Tax=Fertoeibacter niger TaxID=2656921 RepID=A0A8X8KLV1_9RHOB|nr:branched-chain amino acid ABC transporter permease [Fertoeibacter niger]NUB45694.1 branched-chain amino acid ABC transporter permease [Fertoeibacter niger]